VDGLTEERVDRAVESAAYFVVRAGLGGCGTDGEVRVAAVRDDGRLRVSVAGPDMRPPSLVALEDRVGAVGGSVSYWVGPAGEQRLSAELPCG